MVSTNNESFNAGWLFSRFGLQADGTAVVEPVGPILLRSHPLIIIEIENKCEIVATNKSDATSFVPFKNYKREALNGKDLIINKAEKIRTAGTFKARLSAMVYPTDLKTVVNCTALN